MYICLCNAVTDRAIRHAAGTPGCSVSDVYRALGCAPKCGKCVPVVRAMLSGMDNPAAPGDNRA
jgi:bacterioferritin-associated ferredoxin